ncbi:putative glycosyl hydrolase family 85 [Lyophyllum shimeji]|uniref:Glycosyl hydrolase family 85 n=1 Tax=Lyophyllum shimeji TaxID=47721 RepID=A0A9P3PC60_LYOSH|nr:putative glycosyl hydrolase family 85 [Lyophyllum shimeji]
MSEDRKSWTAITDAPYFSSLAELDAWAAGPSHRKLDGILEYTERPAESESRSSGKLLVCHDYKGGYTESPTALSYTFNWWSSCDTFVYFSHHRVTVPPPGWITAAHRQGVKILGTLIFEGDGEEDCLRLLVGNLPSSINGPAKSTPGTTTFPLSPHYARLLAELACQRGFDGYLLNFECPLQGGVEQSRTLAAWITILRSEIEAKVGSHGETVWYDSVTYKGELRWQDRLNSLNLPFFLSSSSLFSNYTWPPHYPNATAEYFLSLDPALTGNVPDSQPQVSKKSLNDVYMGVDVWGRGSHGGGGFGSYKAITHIAPDSLGLSVALFGQGWTWESEQDKPGWDWEEWWEYDSKLWVGPVSGEVHVPEAPRREGEPECPHGPFQPLASFFPRHSPPDPFDLPFHTTFSPGVGRSWFVEGVKVRQMSNGWTDLDKQCSVGDLVWPKPQVEWEGGERDDPVPTVLPSIYFEDAWNAGSSLGLRLLSPGSEAEDAVYRCIWVPIQFLAVSTGRRYEATVYHKVLNSGNVELDLGLSFKPADDTDLLQIIPIAGSDSELWSKLTIDFVVSEGQGAPSHINGALGLVVAIVAEDPSQASDVTILVGQLNVYAVPPQSAAAPVQSPRILSADFVGPASIDDPGILSWDVGVSFPLLHNITITSPDDPVSAWTVQPSNKWFPDFVYFNIYALMITADGQGGQPEDAQWIGTTGLEGIRNTFTIVPQDLPFWSEQQVKKVSKVRFYVQGVTDRGEVLGWDRCVFVDWDLTGVVV